MSDKDARRALIIARKQHALLSRVANIYAGPGGGAYPGPGGGGYAGPGGGRYPGPSRYADGGKIPPFKLHSGAAKLIEAKGQAKATPQQYAAMPGIKPDEIKYGNLTALGSKSMPREEVAKHLRENMVPLEETQLGGAGRNTQGKFSEYQLPGGENYREVLLHLPEHHDDPRVAALKAAARKADENYERAIEAFHNARRERNVPENDPSLSAEHAAMVAAGNAMETAGATYRHEARHYAEKPFKSNHWDEPNVVAHLRMSDRKGPNGEKILHVEEAQSDWGQEGRERGFRGQKSWNPDNIEKVVLPRMGDEPVWAYRHPETGHHIYPANSPAEVEEMLSDNESDKPPAGPYVDNTQKWTDLALKRVLHEAAHGNYDKVVFTPGAEQNKRYSLEQHVDDLRYDPVKQTLNYSLRGQHAYHENIVPKEKLAEHIGKEVTNKLLAAPLVQSEIDDAPVHVLKGEDLRVGGQGMRGYYDNILPKRLQALAQQHDPQAKVQLGGHKLRTATESPLRQRIRDAGYEPDEADVQTILAGNGGRRPSNMTDADLDAMERGEHLKYGDLTNVPLHSLDITPQLRDSIKANGFNQFRFGGEVNDRHHYADGGRAGYADGENSDDHPAWISTRLITSKKHVIVPGEKHIVDLASLKQTPDVYAHNVDLVRNYPNMPIAVAKLKSRDQVADAFIEHVKNNLLTLHDAVPDHIRQRSKLWYDGARAITDRWSEKYGVPDHSIAGALAALSPQKDWYQNVSLAERVLDAMRGNGGNFYNGYSFDKKMAKAFAARPSLNKPAYEGVRKLLNGRTLSDLDRLDLSPEAKAQAKALWIRMHDEAHNDPAHLIVTPEGEMGNYVTTAKGARAKVGWGSLTEIGKAILAIENADNPEALSQLMGEKHKVRNFYNNILAPRSPHGDVTIDTHAVAAGLLRPLSGNSLEVAHNFANYPGKDLPTARGTALTGIQGTYPLYAEAYRRAAAERGILPREMQSITWEAVRGLFPDTAKTVAHNNRVNEIWNEHRKGRIDQNEAQQRIFGLTAPNGIPAPTWFVGGASGVNEGDGSAAGQGTLPQSPVRGAPAGTPDGRARGGSASTVPARAGGASTPSVIDRALALVARL